MEQKAIATFHDFWPHYVRAHSKPKTRMLHAIGSILVLMLLVTAIVWSRWALVLAPLIGYGFAWYAHFFVEGNKPATFGHPFYSLVADYKMVALMLTGRMNAEVAKHT
jgi:hypothetical protein